MKSERGISVTLDYVLMLSIATVVLASVIFASGHVIDAQVDRGVESEMTATGEALAAEFHTVDRLVHAGGSDTTVAVTVELPDHVSGTGYVITIDPDDRELRLRSEDPERTVTVPLRSGTLPSEQIEVSGGILLIEYSTETVEVTSK